MNDCFLRDIQGPVRFYNNERRANILLKQFQSHREVKIGEFNSMENKLMFESGEPLKWVNGEFSAHMCQCQSLIWFLLCRLADRLPKIKRFGL